MKKFPLPLVAAILLAGCDGTKKANVPDPLEISLFQDHFRQEISHLWHISDFQTKDPTPDGDKERRVWHCQLEAKEALWEERDIAEAVREKLAGRVQQSEVVAAAELVLVKPAIEAGRKVKASGTGTAVWKD